MGIALVGMLSIVIIIMLLATVVLISFGRPCGAVWTGNEYEENDDNN